MSLEEQIVKLLGERGRMTPAAIRQETGQLPINVTNACISLRRAGVLAKEYDEVNGVREMFYSLAK